MSEALLNETYYTERDHMSNSTMKEYIECEAQADAIRKGTFIKETTDAMREGLYVHSGFDGTQDQFVEENKQHIFQKNGKMYAGFVKAQAMLEALKADEMTNHYLTTGMHEFIVTGDMYGAEWKAKFDVYDPVAGRIVDLKTCKSITEKVWDGARYVSWIEAYGYARQLAIYAELERLWSNRNKWLSVYICAVSKEDPPDKAIIEIPAERIEWELSQVEANMPRILSVWRGEAKPLRCERCKHCRASKQVKRIITLDELVV